MRVAFEFFAKLGVEYYTFHDRDVAPEGKNLAETNAILDEVTDYMLEMQEKTGIKLLWGTANLFAHPRYMNGGGTAPNADCMAYACAQVKKAMEVTLKLGGENFVFWGGREGYQVRPLSRTCRVFGMPPYHDSTAAAAGAPPSHQFFRLRFSHPAPLRVTTHELALVHSHVCA